MDEEGPPHRYTRPTWPPLKQTVTPPPPERTTNMQPATYMELIEALEGMLATYAPNSGMTAVRAGEEVLLKSVRVARDVVRRTRDNPNPTEVWVPVNVDIARKLNSCVELTKEVAGFEFVTMSSVVDLQDLATKVHEMAAVVTTYNDLIGDAREIIKGSGFNLENGKGFGL